jgi:hypothetical protein
LVVAGIITGILLYARRRRWVAWRQGIRPAVAAAHVSRDLLPAHGRDITDVARWESVRAGAEHAAADLDAAATRAPGGDAASAARSTAQALTGVTFALEAARLMQATQPPPTAGQLAEADATARARQAELDAALARLDAVVGPPEEAAGRAGT